MPVLSRIFIFPIKSTAAIELDEAEVLTDGLAMDRRYVVTDAAGRFLTARRYPRMVLIRAMPVKDGLDVEAPGMATLHLRPEQFPDRHEPVTVWKDAVQGQLCGAQADKWFSEFLGVEARLRFMGAEMHRPARGGGTVTFADAAALLVLSEASVAALNTRLSEPVEVRNFRPNLVVSDCPAYAEDQWQSLSIGDARFEVRWPCTRCVLTTVHPDTGEKHPRREPLATLKKVRGNAEGEAEFGMNLGVRKPGHIRTGQALLL